MLTFSRGGNWPLPWLMINGSFCVSGPAVAELTSMFMDATLAVASATSLEEGKSAGGSLKREK